MACTASQPILFDEQAPFPQIARSRNIVTMRLPFVATLSAVAALTVLAGVFIYASRVRQAPPAAKPVHAVLHAARPKPVAPKIEPQKIEPIKEAVNLPSAFEVEEQMSPHQRMQRWAPLIAEA